MLQVISGGFCPCCFLVAYLLAWLILQRRRWRQYILLDYMVSHPGTQSSLVAWFSHNLRIFASHAEETRFVWLSNPLKVGINLCNCICLILHSFPPEHTRRKLMMLIAIAVWTGIHAVLGLNLSQDSSYPIEVLHGLLSATKQMLGWYLSWIMTTFSSLFQFICHPAIPHCIDCSTENTIK